VQAAEVYQGRSSTGPRRHAVISRRTFHATLGSVVSAPAVTLGLLRRGKEAVRCLV
jgi:mRNA-degrading endonuclease toxin of MazEF toxin-antitoxin module